jgi:hypothetical protein
VSNVPGISHGLQSIVHAAKSIVSHASKILQPK